jgi:hypothetical protein
MFSRFMLRDNPFGIVPVEGVDIFADRTKLKKEVDFLLTNILGSTPSRLAACFFGDWGAGKTHMASYYSRPALLQDYAKKLGIAMPISLKLITPASSIIDTFYLNTLDLVDISLLKKTVEGLIASPSVVQTPQHSIEVLKPLVKDTYTALAFLQSEDLLKAYLYQSATPRELKEVGIPRGISTDSDKLNALRAVLNLLTRKYSRVVIWLDDAERIRNLSGRDLTEFQIFMRDLLDYVPSNLGIIMLFTLSPTEEVNDAILYLGDALRSRLSHSISVEEMTRADFKKYISDLMEHFRTTEGRSVDEYFPFDEQVVEHIYDKMMERDTFLKRQQRGSLSITPRNINLVCSQLLETAAKEPKTKKIDNNLVDSVMTALL